MPTPTSAADQILRDLMIAAGHTPEEVDNFFAHERQAIALGEKFSATLGDEMNALNLSNVDHEHMFRTVILIRLLKDYRAWSERLSPFARREGISQLAEALGGRVIR